MSSAIVSSAALPAPRLYGLDTLRASAIALVFMYHYMVFVSHQQTFGWLSEIGWVGVDLFFVLSGYLIANQLFQGMRRGQILSLRAFYLRRALRTLPLFWLTLAAYCLLGPMLGGKTPPALWRFLTFTQNFQLQPGTAFSHAWSLCIEEQFYLFLPLVLVAGVALKPYCKAGIRLGWWLMALLLLLGVSARLLLWLQYGRESFGQVASYYPNVYYATLCRFDEFLPGVAVAMLKNFHPAFWQRIIANGQRVLLAGGLATLSLLALAYHFYYIDGYGYGFFMSVFGYSLIAAAFALLVVAALSPHTILARTRIPGAAQLALWSYAIYLSHKPLAHVLQSVMKANGYSPMVMVWLISVACIAIGAVLYRLVEVPMMALRERLTDGNFLPQQGGTRESGLALPAQR